MSYDAIKEMDRIIIIAKQLKSETDLLLRQARETLKRLEDYKRRLEEEVLRSRKLERRIMSDKNLRFQHDFEEDMRLTEIEQGINYAVKQGWLSDEEADKMTTQELEEWLSENVR
ncbi:MAG: hypothetical protein H8D26_03640 [Methanomicrobia archaeon]|nr:hypothetical protein [Methanomicrobia archaeon]